MDTIFSLYHKQQSLFSQRLKAVFGPKCELEASMNVEAVMNVCLCIVSDACVPVWQFVRTGCHCELIKRDALGFSSVQSLSRVRLFATPRTTARQASLSITNSQSLLKLMSIESVMPSSHLILCRPLLLLPSMLASIRVFSNEPALRIRQLKDWRFSFNTKSFQ